MPSAEPVASPTPSTGRTLTRRLAWALVLAATLGATIALVSALLVADALVRAQVERSTRDAAHVMAVELGEDLAMVPLVDEEAHELGIQARVAVLRGQEVLEGDVTLMPGAHEAGGPGCQTLEGATADEIVCREPLVGHPELTVVVAVVTDPAHRLPMLLAGLAGLAVVVAAAALVGLVLARRFLAPLDRLRQAVVDVDATAPAAVELPARTGLEEIDALRTALSSLLTRLDGELARARRFAAHAAHELRTPLARMLTELELAVEVATTPEHADTLGKVQRSTERLIGLTERLLLLATPHDSLAVAQATSMTQLVEDLGLRRPPAEVARLVLETDASDGLVRGDVVLLGMLLDNVVDNALKFSSGPVRVRVHEDGDDVLVVVDDQGPGLPTESTELFEPFRRGPAMAHLPGHGLGLALVAHIARTCGGKVWFEQGRPVGACFNLRLPAVRRPTPGTRQILSMPDGRSPNI